MAIRRTLYPVKKSQRPGWKHVEICGRVGLQIFHIEDIRNSPQAAQQNGVYSQSQRRRNDQQQIGPLLHNGSDHGGSDEGGLMQDALQRGCGVRNIGIAAENSNPVAFFARRKFAGIAWRYLPFRVVRKGRAHLDVVTDSSEIFRAICGESSDPRDFGPIINA